MKTIVIEATQCPSCGKPMPAGALAGLCPACLLAQGLGTDAGGGRSGPFVPPPLEVVAKLFPQLEILGLLGAGGMGAVYKARQPALDRIVALKILPSHNEEGANFAERFNREARALARLNHPNIVAVFEFGQAGALSFFIMEFVDGANLRQLERAGRLAPREALQIIPQICDALQYAHDEGVVHRDIKPENVLVDRKGRVKIADFGLAKILGQDVESLRLTAEGQVMGTPHYMAPEQIEKPLTVDHRADIYSLGVVLYEMLTGDLPLGKFAPPSRKYQLDVRLDDVVLRALENDPARRYQRASEVKTQVENIAGTPTPATPAAPAPEQNVFRWAGFPVVSERDGARKVNRKEALKMFGIFFGLLTVAFGLVSVFHGQNLFGWLGISGATSLQLRLLAAALVTAFGVWCALRSKPASTPPPQTPQGTVILPPEKFSRKALFGACWMPFALFAFLGMFMVWSEAPAGSNHGPQWWQILLAVATLPLGFTAPFGTTILGWLAVSDIRRARGRIGGLPLAVFNGLFFPLLALDAFVYLGCVNVALALHRAVDAFRSFPLFAALLPFMAAGVCALIDFLVVRRVWRAVRLENPPAARADGDWWWSRRSGAVAIGLACVGLIMANVWRQEKSGPRAAVQQSFAAPDARTGTFIAQLPGRGTVELLAVSDAGAASNAWWLPNGSLIPDTPYAFSNIGDVSSPGLTNKDFVLRWRDLPVDADGPEIEFAESGGTSSGGQVWRNRESYWGTWPLRAAFPPTASRATLRVGFDFADWQTVSVHDRNGNGSFLPTPPGLSRFQSQVHQVGENRGEAQLTLVLPEKSRDWKVRVVAVDTNGVQHARHRGTGTPATKASVQTYEFMELPLARVKEFRVQVRPVHWVEFRGVALQGRGLVKRTALPQPSVPLFEPTKTIVLTRATNQPSGDSGDVRTVGVWSDNYLQPGEALRTGVKTQDGEKQSSVSHFFVHCKQGDVQTRSGFTWFLKGAFGEKEAQAAVAQMQASQTERPLTLTSHQPLEMFSITNRFGGVMVGYVEYVRTDPLPVKVVDGAAVKVRALVRIKQFTGYFPSVSYSAEVPPGYALRMTASDGEVSTHTSADPREYSSTWFQPIRLPPSSGPVQRQVQQAAFQAHLQALQEQGPLEVILGEPRLLFSITNSPGDVIHSFLELVGPNPNATR